MGCRWVTADEGDFAAQVEHLNIGSALEKI
ncbi:hypothetical protein N599_12410 [Saccharopolyspora erythraea D]|nr:hypothetical protein N599_12410 [Saccharopolyspora erythraea D]